MSKNDDLLQVTLYHFDHPQILEDQFKGWQSFQMVEKFKEYAAFVFEKYSSKVCQINREMPCCFSSDDCIYGRLRHQVDFFLVGEIVDNAERTKHVLHVLRLNVRPDWIVQCFRCRRVRMHA